MILTRVPPVLLLSLALVLWGDRVGAKASTLQYGFYSPFPPAGGDQVVYDFSPVSEDSSSNNGFQQSNSKRPKQQQQQQQQQGHRSTRDLAWKEFDTFLSGEVEPSCEDLRKMWRLARKMQDHAIRTNEIRPELHPFLSYSAKSNSPATDNGSLETTGPSSDTTADDNRRKADR